MVMDCHSSRTDILLTHFLVETMDRSCGSVGRASQIVIQAGGTVNAKVMHPHVRRFHPSFLEAAGTAALLEYRHLVLKLVPPRIPASLIVPVGFPCRIIRGSDFIIIADESRPLQGQGRTGMATTDVSLHKGSSQAEQKPVVNNMSIQVATV